MLHDLILQPQEGLRSTFSVEQGHIDVEDPQQAVRLVLRTRRLPSRRPSHPLRNADTRQRSFERQNRLRDSRDLPEERGQIRLGAQ